MGPWAEVATFVYVTAFKFQMFDVKERIVFNRNTRHSDGVEAESLLR